MLWKFCGPSENVAYEFLFSKHNLLFYDIFFLLSDLLLTW